MTPRTRREQVSQYGFLAALVRAHRCETDKEDEVDAKRRRRCRRKRRRRLQAGFNETSRGPSNRFSGFSSPFATSSSVSFSLFPLSFFRAEDWQEEVEVERASESESGEASRPLSIFFSYHSPLLSNHDAYLKHRSPALTLAFGSVEIYECDRSSQCARI